jgi:hypothetical protein
MTILFSNYISNYFQINHKNKFDINLITIFIWIIDFKKYSNLFIRWYTNYF